MPFSPATIDLDARHPGLLQWVLQQTLTSPQVCLDPRQQRQVHCLARVQGQEGNHWFFIITNIIIIIIIVVVVIIILITVVVLIILLLG